MRGEDVRVNQVVDLLEKHSGTVFRVSAVSEAELEEICGSIQGIGSTGPQIRSKLAAQLNLVFLKEEEDMGLIRPTVNQLCPHIKPQSVETFLKELFA